MPHVAFARVTPKNRGDLGAGFGERQLSLCQLRAWALMVNHVHISIYPKPACRGSPKPSRIIRRARPMPSLRIIGRTGSPFWQECGGRKSWPRSFAISRRIRWWRAGEQRGTFTYDRWDRPPGLSFCHARTPDRGRRSHRPVAVVKRLDCSSAERTRRTRRPGVATDSAAFPMSRKLSGIGGRVPISAEPRTSLSGRFASC